MPVLQILLPDREQLPAQITRCAYDMQLATAESVERSVDPVGLHRAEQLVGDHHGAPRCLDLTGQPVPGEGQVRVADLLGRGTLQIHRCEEVRLGPVTG